jgi:hypothetical protein
MKMYLYLQFLMMMLDTNILTLPKGPQYYCGEMFDKCLHFLSIFLARKLTTGLTIRYVSLSLNIIEMCYYYFYTQNFHRDSNPRVFRDCGLCSSNIQTIHINKQL